MELVQTGKWFELHSIQDPYLDMNELKGLRSFREELACHPDNLLLRGNRIVLPTELREKAISLAHEGHQGMSRTKSLIRSKLWFPGLNEKVENAVRNCLACQSTFSGPPPMEPLNMSKLPDGPWQKLFMDFCGPLPTGEHLLVITDKYSRYPVVEIVNSVSANTTIPVIDKVLSVFSYPLEIKTDNGSPFNSTAFTEFAANSGFKHRKITPHWPRANAQAESLNKPLMKSIRAAIINRKSWKQEVHKFLRQYRATVHPSTGFSPFRLMFGREPQTKLPQVKPEEREIEIKNQVKMNDTKAKLKSKHYADARNKATPCSIQVGDTVIVKYDSKQDKFSSPYNPKPHTV